MTLKIFSSLLIVLLANGSVYHRSAVQSADPGVSTECFGDLMTALSEPEGYFDSDNLISNEAGYLQVLPALERLGVRGGAYLGVGPDQNYSYIAQIHPRMAIIVDIRRQNALLHLYFKALFQLSNDRIAFMERLFGRPVRGKLKNGNRSEIRAILAGFDRVAPDPVFNAARFGEAESALKSWNLALTDNDFRSIERAALEFAVKGPEIKFTSYNRSPRPHHPTYRELLEGDDGNGIRLSYLAVEERFRTVKRLHRENRIIPVVGDFAGPSAFRRISAELQRRGLEIRCFYASNVEFYLFRGPRWSSYLENLRAMPWASESYVIRTYANMPGRYAARGRDHYMTSVMQRLGSFLANEQNGKIRSYWDLVMKDCVAP